MATYRLLYFKQGEPSGPDDRVTLTCEDDAEAIRLALDRANGRMMQLWRGGVFLKSWPAKGRR